MLLNTTAAYTTTTSNRVKDAPARAGQAADPTYETYDLISEALKITVPATGGETMTFTAGELTVRIYAGIAPATPQLMQTLHILMPGGTFPIPKLGEDTTYAKSGTLGWTQVKQWFWSFTKAGAVSGIPGRLYYASEPPGSSIPHGTYGVR